MWWGGAEFVLFKVSVLSEWVSAGGQACGARSAATCVEGDRGGEGGEGGREGGEGKGGEGRAEVGK